MGNTRITSENDKFFVYPTVKMNEEDNNCEIVQDTVSLVHGCREQLNMCRICLGNNVVDKKYKQDDMLFITLKNIQVTKLLVTNI